MRRWGSAALRHGGQTVGLPTVVEELLVEVVADGFALYCCGPKAAPRALVASYEWADWVDLLTVQDFDRVITARAPKQGRTVDIFDPGIVVWAYEGPPENAVRALLDLVHPTHPDAPTLGYPAPAGLRVPRVVQRPMTIHLPTPGRAGVRAARLVTAMTTHGDDHAVAAAVPAGTDETAGWLSVERAAPDAQLPAVSRSPLNTGEEDSMLTRSAPAVQNPWRDIDGSRIALFSCRVEQVTEDTVLPSRLHQRGQVVGRGLDLTDGE